VVGLQTAYDVENFLLTCQWNLPEAAVDHERRVVYLDGHGPRVNAYPVSVDVAELERLARSEEVSRYEERIRPLLGEKTIVRVDRVDPAKNILHGFEAYDMLLQHCPTLVGRVNFLAFLVPSRTSIREYKEYTQQVFALVDKINARHRKAGWKPIKVFYEHNYAQAIAGMRLYDVLLVNPVADGMNLVAKEGPVVNTRDGVLVLSKKAGAHEQLSGDCISVEPADIEGTAQALYRALTMTSWERIQKAQRLRMSVRKEDITWWLGTQLDDLCKVVRKSRLETIAGEASFASADRSVVSQLR